MNGPLVYLYRDDTNTFVMVPHDSDFEDQMQETALIFILSKWKCCEVAFYARVLVDREARDVRVFAGTCHHFCEGVAST